MTDKVLVVLPDLTTFLRWCKERGGGIEAAREKGVMLIGNTVKGRGVSFMENSAKWHYRCPTPEEKALAMRELIA